MLKRENIEMPPQKLKTKHLVSGLAGMLCPIPVVGEALVSGLLYPIYDEIFQKSNPVLNITASMAAAGLMRMKLYEIAYLPMMESVYKYFS